MCDTVYITGPHREKSLMSPDNVCLRYCWLYMTQANEAHYNLILTSVLTTSARSRHTFRTLRTSPTLQTCRVLVYDRSSCVATSGAPGSEELMWSLHGALVSGP